MVLIIGQLMLWLSSVSGVNYGCSDSSCSSCTSGVLKLFESKSCLELCPTGYSSSASSCSQSSASKSLLATKFYEQQKFTEKIVGDFSSAVEFNSASRTSPIPTKERGFYFDKNSGLFTFPQSKVLSPDLTMRLLLRLTGCDFALCTIFELLVDSKVVFSLSADSTQLISKWVLKRSSDLGETPYELKTPFEYQKWFKVLVYSSQQLSFVQLNHALLENYGNGEGELKINAFEFRHTSGLSQIESYLGGSESFKGFLYDLNLDNGVILTYGISAHLVECNYNQFYLSPQCFDCDPSCSTWPWCVRRGECLDLYKNLCFSSKCPKCSGYTPGHCESSPVQCFRFCSSCDLVIPYKCLSCPSHLTLINNICIYKPYNWDPSDLDRPSVSLTFETFEQYYGGLFQSGHDEGTFAPFHYPDRDDPIPMKNRGLYFTNSSKLKSISEISMFYENSFFIWAKPLGIGFNFWNSPSILLYSEAYSSLLLSDSETWTRFNSIEKKVSLTGWKFYAFVHSFASNDFHSEVYVNAELVSQYTAPGYLLYDIRTTVWILGEGFLYSLNAYNKAKTDVLLQYRDAVCGTGGFLTCLSDCDQNQFFDGNSCQDCPDDCEFGCIDSTSCRICAESECLTCTSFASSVCVSMNSSNCAPGWQSYEAYNGCCSQACLNCDGPFDFSCTECHPGFYLAGSQCAAVCPAGFEENEGKCILVNALIADYVFDTIYDVYQSPKYPVSFATGQDSSFYPDHLASDPIPAVKRGLYFKQTSFMTSSSFSFADSLTIVMWVKFYRYGQVFRKNNLSLLTSDQSYFQLTQAGSLKTVLPPLYTWTSLYLKVWTSLSHRINAAVGSLNRNYEKYQGNVEYLSDSYSSFVLGNPEEGFVGFLYRVVIFNSNADVMSFKEEAVCSVNVVDSCLWDCDFGYYWNGLNCGMCGSRCQSGCKDQSHCNICADQICYNCHDYSDTCDHCKDHARFYQNSCVCNPRYYWNLPTETCEPCDSSCKLCTKPGECLECADEFCEECLTIYTQSCIECISGFEAVDGSCVKCTVSQFYDSRNKKCIDCPLPCKTCPNLKTCTECMINAHFTSRGLCECDEGFFLNSSTKACQQTYFSIKYSISNKNVIKLHFEEDLLKDLREKDLKISVTTSSVSFSLNKINQNKWEVELELSEKADSSTRVHLDIISQLYSKDKSLFIPKHYTALLFIQDDINTEGLSEVTTVAQGALFTVLASVIGTTLILSDPTSLFFFLQTLELYVYVLIYLVQISPALKFCLQLLSLGSFIPNFFEILIPSSLGVKMTEKLKEFGYENNLFIVNSGVNIFTICVLSVLLPFFYVLMKIPIKYVKEKAEKIIKDYHFRVVCRCFIQMFLEFVLNAFFGLTFNKFQNSMQIFDFGLCIVVAVVMIIGIVLFFRILMRKMENFNDLQIDHNWGTFFDGIRSLKNCQFFYVFYFLRRFVLACLIAFIPSDLMQLVVSAIFSMAIAVYVINFQPFTLKRINFYMMVSEFLLVSFYLTLITGILSNGSISVYTVGSAGIRIVICVLIFNAAFVLFELAQYLYEKVKNKDKTRIVPSNTNQHLGNVTCIMDPDELFRNPSVELKQSPDIRLSG